MKKLLLILILITGIIRLNAQTTATDFTAFDCEGNSYNLFTQLNIPVHELQEFYTTCTGSRCSKTTGVKCVIEGTTNSL